MNYETLDTPLPGQGVVEFDLAGPGKRLANLFIDALIFYALTFIAGILIALAGKAELLENKGILYGLSFTIHFLYYFLMEGLVGKTIGKLITRTHVVGMDGQKIAMSKAAGRALCRFIPFEAFSFLGSSNAGWHDIIPGTRVVKD